MADKTPIEQFVESFDENTGLPGANTEGLRASVAALADNYDRYTAKQFVKMVSQIKKTKVTLANVGNFELTAKGAESLFNLLETSTALEPKYKADGTLDINTDTTKDTVVVGGDFVKEQPIVNAKGVILSETVTGKNIILNDATIGDYSYEKFTPTANGNVTLNNLTVDGSTGNLSNKNWNAPNTPLNFSSTGNVTINGMTMTANNDPSAVPQTNYENSIYNALEIWGNPKSIVIKDCNFVNSFSNNAINIFGMADGGKALIENCVFDYASNILRIGSQDNGFENSYNCVIEFRNCVFKNWDTDKMWGSFALCQFDSVHEPAVNNVKYTRKNIYGTDANGTHITIRLVDCYRDAAKTQLITPYGDITKQFGPNVFVTDNGVIQKYPNSTSLLVNGTMTDVSGQDMVDTANRMMILYGRLLNMSSKTIVPDEVAFCESDALKDVYGVTLYPTFEIVNS